MRGNLPGRIYVVPRLLFGGVVPASSVIVPATAVRIISAATSMVAVTGSPSTAQPSTRATTGLT